MCYVQNPDDKWLWEIMSPFCYFLASNVKGKNFALACAYIFFEFKWELLIPKKEYPAPILRGRRVFLIHFTTLEKGYQSLKEYLQK